MRNLKRNLKRRVKSELWLNNDQFPRAYICKMFMENSKVIADPRTMPYYTVEIFVEGRRFFPSISLNNRVRMKWLPEPVGNCLWGAYK